MDTQMSASEKNTLIALIAKRNLGFWWTLDLVQSHSFDPCWARRIVITVTIPTGSIRGCTVRQNETGFPSPRRRRDLPGRCDPLSFRGTFDLARDRCRLELTGARLFTGRTQPGCCAAVRTRGWAVLLCFLRWNSGEPPIKTLLPHFDVARSVFDHRRRGSRRPVSNAIH